MRAWVWLWSERRRRNLVLSAVAALALALVVIVGTVRTHQARQAWGGVMAKAPSMSADAEAHDDIVRPSGGERAQAVVRAWLAGDDATLAALATPDLAAVLRAGATPTGQAVVGASLSEDYDTFQSWSVALADGSHVEVELSWARLGDASWTATTVRAGA